MPLTQPPKFPKSPKFHEININHLRLLQNFLQLLSILQPTIQKTKARLERTLHRPLHPQLVRCRTFSLRQTPQSRILAHPPSFLPPIPVRDCPTASFGLYTPSTTVCRPSIGPSLSRGDDGERERLWEGAVAYCVPFRLWCRLYTGVGPYDTQCTIRTGFVGEGSVALRAQALPSFLLRR